MMEVKTIELFGKPLFNLLSIYQPVKLDTSMPEDEAGFVYILKGECINYSEIEEFSLKANQAILAKCGNSTFTTLNTIGATEYQAIIIKFHKSILERLYQDTISPFRKNAIYPLRVNSAKVEVNELLAQYINHLLGYFTVENPIPEDLLILKLKELLLLLLHTNQAHDVLGIMNNLFKSKTFEFKEVIKSHIFSPLSIEELANLTNHSLSSFKKRFKEIFNDTPARYIINKRIEKVAELLPNSEESISNIAYDCEFKTLAHMSRVFKGKYGLSPSEYRLTFSDKR